MKPHIHAEVIKAWADGAEIQIWSEQCEGWLDVEVPQWGQRSKYRVKPLCAHLWVNSIDGTFERCLDCEETRDNW